MLNRHPFPWSLLTHVKGTAPSSCTLFQRGGLTTGAHVFFPIAASFLRAVLHGNRPLLKEPMLTRTVLRPLKALKKPGGCSPRRKKSLALSSWLGEAAQWATTRSRKNLQQVAQKWPKMRLVAQNSRSKQGNSQRTWWLFLPFGFPLTKLKSK